MQTEEVRVRLQYHDAQLEIFESLARKKVVSKGRRFGFTKGCAQFVIQRMSEGISPVLWGDTIHTNITNYIERYFIPVLNKLPKGTWEWKKQEKKIYIGASVCDFRSADQPENWEGFGYRLIILNEAGIILRNRYLWHNTVRPMLMDYPDSMAIIGGTPKGKGIFFDLFKKGGKELGWEKFQFSSYDNPYLEKSEIEAMERELPPEVAKQEIYGEFLDSSTHVLISYDLIQKAIKQLYPSRGREIWGLDIARHGEDDSSLAKRSWKDLYEVKAVHIPDTMQLASYVASEYRQAEKKPSTIFIEVTGMGWGVYDRLHELGLPVYPADVGQTSVE
jgi:hypothetical protein